MRDEGVKSEAGPARRGATSGFRGGRGPSDLDVPSALRGGHRSRERFAGVGFLSPETVSLPGRQSAVTIIMPYRESTPSRGVTRGVAVGLQTPIGCDPREEGRRNALPPPPLSPPPPLTRALTLYRLVGESIYDLRATSPSPICTKSLTSLLVIFSA